MSGRETTVKAIEALKAIRSGMSDAALMEEFDLSASALQSLFGQLVAADILRESEVHARGALAPGSVVLGVTKDIGTPDVRKKPVIDAGEALRCIRCGLDDATIMTRFDITAKGLQSLFNKLVAAGAITPKELVVRSKEMPLSPVVVEKPSNVEVEQPSSPPRKPVIDAADALNSIRAGLDDASLMKRYEISAQGLHSLFAKLVGAGAISCAELEQRLATSHNDVIVDEGVPEASPATQGNDRLDLNKIVDEVRSAVSHEAMMERFSLSSKDLNEVLKGLVTQGLISQAELDRSLSQNCASLEIRHRTTGHVVHRGMERSLGALVEKAVQGLVNLAEVDLAGANLSRRDLSGAQMARADLRKAILVGTDLTGADLSGAVLKSADLYGATLHKANLASVDLSDSNMTMVNAMWAFMPNINLAEANLTNANLTGANLAGANLFESILNGTKVDGAYLVGAQLDYVRKD